jgi:hypothetical protein
LKGDLVEELFSRSVNGSAGRVGIWAVSGGQITVQPEFPQGRWRGLGWYFGAEIRDSPEFGWVCGWAKKAREGCRRGFRHLLGNPAEAVPRNLGERQLRDHNF